MSKNFKVVRAEHETKPRALLSTGHGHVLRSCETSPVSLARGVFH